VGAGVFLAVIKLYCIYGVLIIKKLCLFHQLCT
jgi:hypothetical protein